MREERALPRGLLIAAAVCFAVVVLTHVAEALHIVTAMGWGMPNSAGHYVDLGSAVLGGVLLALGLGTHAFRRLRRCWERQ